MSSLVNNFVVSSTELTDTYSKIVFKFDMIPLINDIGGYRIYKSYNANSTGVYDRMVIDVSSSSKDAVEITTNLNGSTYFNYYVHTADFGRVIYISLVPVNRLGKELIGCAPLRVNAHPSAPATFSMCYDNFTVQASWTPPSIYSGANTDISNYVLKRANCISISGVVLNSSGNLSHTLFGVGLHVFVVDQVKKSYWYGTCVTSGEFILDEASRFPLVSDISGDYEVSINNLRIFMEGDFTQIGLVDKATLTFEDTTFSKESLYFYSLSALVGQEEGYSLFYPLYTLSLPNVSPYLRTVGNSENSYLSSIFWRKLTNVLIDQNYYNKQSFDIPHIQGMYNFTGFLGLYNCKVDVFINDQYNNTVITDHSGSFSFAISLTKSNSKIQLQARDMENIGFSMKSNPQIVRLVTIYSFFTALAQEYTYIWKEILLQMKDFSFATSRTVLLENKLSPFVGITKDISEDDASFTAFITQAFLAYEYAGYQQGLYMILNAMNANISEFDHYELFFNDSLMHTHCTGYVYTVNYPLAVLARKNYIYAVTGVNDAGEESGATILRVDDRFWATNLTAGGIATSTGYSGYNYLRWDPTGAATKYNIYRQTVEGADYSILNFKFLHQCQDTIFVDIGTYTEVDKYPPEYTITEFYPPTNVHVYNYTHVTNTPTSKKNSNWIRIIIYQKDTMAIPAFQLARLQLLLADMVPPELGYTVVLCNDNYSKILI